MSSSSRNASDEDGWVESKDPKSGRTFYANRLTRTTQWEAPPGWKKIHTNANNPLSVGFGDNAANTQNSNGETLLPDGWEEMIDPSSGRTFYIDHVSKITSWERPKVESAKQTIESMNNSDCLQRQQRKQQRSEQQRQRDDDFHQYFNSASILTLNQNGSHSHWDDDPRTGSRRSNNSHCDNTSTLSSGPPPPRLDFKVITIPDSLRQHCPSCSNPFSSYTLPLRRKHHCRLCGDIFCDACSNQRTILPLDGEEFNVPVRVCNVCMKDVKRGNYFTLRRYLTSLQLYRDENDDHVNNAMEGVHGHYNSKSGGKKDDSSMVEQQIMITLDMVAASLSSLSTDIDAMLLIDEEPPLLLSSFSEKMTIPANILIPAVARHLKRRQTGEYAVRVLATLLQLGNVVGDESFGLALLGCKTVIVKENDADDAAVGVDGVEEKKLINKSESTNDNIICTKQQQQQQQQQQDANKNHKYVNDILKILEWNGNDTRTLSAQEQAVKVMYYITDPNFIAGALRSMKESFVEEDEKCKNRRRSSESSSAAGPVDVDAAADEYYNNTMNGEVNQIDVHRAFRSMLDHATSSASPSLQRWATACLRHLITEDQRRACSVAYLSSSSSFSSLKYESFTSQLVQTGGIMILCSLLNSDDGETRAHAISALEAIVFSTREIGLLLHHSIHGTTKKGRGFSRVGRGTKYDSAIVDAIISNIGVSESSGLPALAHLLISADESVSMMGCSFILSLISPLLTDPRGSGRTFQQCSNLTTMLSSSSSGVGSFEGKGDGLSSYRNAAIALVVGEDTLQGHLSSCLPSLIAIVRSGLEGMSLCEGGNKARPLKVQTKAAECLAAVALAIGHVIGTNSEQSLVDSTYIRAKSALELMEQERLFDVALQIITSDSYRSLDPSRNTPESRLREAAGLVLLALSSCSSVSFSYLMGHGAVSTLLTIASEPKMLSTASSVRGHFSSKGLCFLETATTLLMQAWTNSKRNEDDTSSLNFLLEALNSGAVGLASRLVKTKVTLKSHEKAYSQLQVKIAICFMLTSMFGIANTSHANKNDVGTSRLYSAIDADCAQFLASGGIDTGVRADLVGATMNLLSATLPYAHQFTKEDADEPLPMVDLSISCLLAVGSMCGLADPIGTYSSVRINDVEEGKYSYLRLDACTMACNILTTMQPNEAALLPTVLVGAINESLIVPTLRLSLAICQYGDVDLRAELSRSGMLVPVVDILQRASASPDYYTFIVAVSLVRFCGQCTVVGNSASGTVETLKVAIQILSCVLAPETGNGRSFDSHRLKQLSELKYECLVALEALVANDALQTTIATVALPALLQHVKNRHSFADEADIEETVFISLRTIQKVVNISSTAQYMMNNGITSILVDIFEQGDEVKNKRLQEVSLEIVQSIVQSDRKTTYRLICSGLMKSLLMMLGECEVTLRRTRLGLQIAEILLSDLRSFLSRFESSQKEELLQQVVDIFGSQRNFVRRLIASLSDDCKVFGQPFVFPKDAVVGASRDKAAELLFIIFSLFLVHDQEIGKARFFDALKLIDVAGSDVSAAAACSALLDVLSDDEATPLRPFFNPDERSFYFDVELPTIQNHLIKGLSIHLNQALTSSASKTDAEGLIKKLKLLRTCLVLCGSEKLAESAFRLFEDVVLSLPIDSVGDLILCDRVALITMFDLVTGQANKVPDLDYSKQTFAKLLGDLAKAGLLPKAVDYFGVRSRAIAALSAAMLIDAEGENIDDDEDSIQRICLESLVIILCGDDEEIQLTPLESRTLATAVGKLLSSTVLNRFFTQASLESAIDDPTVDFELNRASITKSAEARLLCAMAQFPESIEVLSRVGGLESMGLIAHEGEINAVKAVQKACEMNPQLVVDAEAHLSIMDALIRAEEKLLSASTNTNLCDVVVRCLEIVTTLSVISDTRDAIICAEQSRYCMKIASNIVLASAHLKLDIKSGLVGIEDVRAVETAKKLIATAADGEDIQIGDHVRVNSHVNSTPIKTDSSPKKRSETLEGVVSYLGSVQFAPGGDWVGIRLTGSSVGKGKNDGIVKGTHYFDCEEKDGVFVKRSNVWKREIDHMSEGDSREKSASVLPKQHNEPWKELLMSGDTCLEKASFPLLQSFSRSKVHRDAMMNNREFTTTLACAIRSSTITDFKRDALELLSSFTTHYFEPEEDLMHLFCDVIESQTRTLQLSQDKLEQSSSEQLLVVVVSAMQNLFFCCPNARNQTRPLRVASNLFSFLSDTLFSGPRTRRMAVSKTEGVLLSNLSSFLVLSLGNEDTRRATLTPRLVTSLIRLIVMTSRVEAMGCHVSFYGKDGEEHWETAHAHCLHYLTLIVNEATQVCLGTTYASLIDGCQPSSNSFRMCLQNIADRSHGGAPQVLARILLEKLERLS